MQKTHSTESNLRIRKCGSSLDNNNKPGDYGDDIQQTWSIEAQASGKSSTERSETTDNTLVTKMSTTPKKTISHHSSLFESTAEDMTQNCGSENSEEMWRNELSLGKDVQSETDQEDQKELPVASSFKRLSDLVDIVIRIAIVLVFIKLETMSSFVREIHSEELWLYKNPRKPDIVRGSDLLFLVITVPLFITAICYAFTKDRRDFRAASWAWTLAVCMNSIPTSLLKITVGRPRPDFFYRCFPDGVMVLNETSNTMGSSLLDFVCTGNPSDINEGRKSFPSGHSSFAFASFGFVAFYVGAKLHAFDARGRGQTWRLAVSVLPLILAALVAVSRTCDYHHHWQDITVGGIIGLLSGYYSYRQYYPSIFSAEAGRPYIRWPRHNRFEIIETNDDAGGDLARRPLLGKESNKWY